MRQDASSPKGQAGGSGRPGQGRGQGQGRGGRCGQGQSGRAGLAQTAPAGNLCVCPQCGQTAPHTPGQPCADMRCPACGAAMTRQ